MKASPSSILNHPSLSEGQKAIGLLAKFAESITNAYDTRYDRKKKGDCQSQWALESTINQLQSTLPSLTTINGNALLKALDFHGYTVFMRDPSGRVFPVLLGQSYHLNEGKVRVRSQASREYNPTNDRISYGLMFHDVHESVKGTKVLLLNVNTTFSAIYPSVVEF